MQYYCRLLQEGFTAEQIHQAAEQANDGDVLDVCRRAIEEDVKLDSSQETDGEAVQGGDDRDSSEDDENEETEERAFPFPVRVNETPLDFVYARRAEGVALITLLEYADWDGDDDVKELCDLLGPIEKGQPRFTPAQLAEIDDKLDVARRAVAESERATKAAQVLLGDCLEARRREGGRSPRRRPSTAMPRPPGMPVAGNRISLLTAAAMLLAETGQAMNCRSMLEIIMRRGIWSSPSGKTPDATLNGGIITEIKDKGLNSRFQKVAPGQFAATPLFVEMHRASGLTLAMYEPKPADAEAENVAGTAPAPEAEAATEGESAPAEAESNDPAEADATDESPELAEAVSEDGTTA